MKIGTRSTTVVCRSFSRRTMRWLGRQTQPLRPRRARAHRSGLEKGGERRGGEGHHERDESHGQEPDRHSMDTAPPLDPDAGRELADNRTELIVRATIRPLSRLVARSAATPVDGRHSRPPTRRLDRRPTMASAHSATGITLARAVRSLVKQMRSDHLSTTAGSRSKGWRVPTWS